VGASHNAHIRVGFPSQLESHVEPNGRFRLLSEVHVLIDLFIFQVLALVLRNLDGLFVVGHDSWLESMARICVFICCMVANIDGILYNHQGATFFLAESSLL
jgi:hypothetical protein